MKILILSQSLFSIFVILFLPLQSNSMVNLPQKSQIKINNFEDLLLNYRSLTNHSNLNNKRLKSHLKNIKTLLVKKSTNSKEKLADLKKKHSHDEKKKNIKKKK